MKSLEKIIATILIISMILSLGLNIFLFKPKKAKAILGIGDIVIDVVNEVKEWIVDEIPRRVARHMMVRLQQEIARWAQGGFTDENRPFAMTSWKKEIWDALMVASGRFVEEFNLTPLCLPIRFTLGERLGLTQIYSVPYTQYAACTLETVVDNITDFYENPSIGLWGWDTWTALSQPQNNIFGSFLLAAERRAEIEKEEKEEKEMQKDIGGGYRPEQDCLEYQEMTEAEMARCKDDCFTDECEKYIESDYYTKCVDSCQVNCEQRQTGICLEYRTKNIGSTIHSAVEKAIGSDIDWLISAHEITEMFGLIFSGLFNKLFHGTGIAGQPFYRAEPTVAKYQLQYGYYKEYKKAQTPEDIKNLRRDILDNILKAIKRVTTNSYECDKDYQLKGEVFSEVAAEILEEESQHLYAGREGVDLKPDYEVLDGPAAVENGIAIYGVTWDDIPFSRYPPKCSEILGIKCRDISTGLPEELSSDCARCVSRLNDIRINTCDKARDQCLKQCPSDDEACKTGCQQEREACNENAYSQAVSEGACSSYNAAYSCLSQSWLIHGTENRCSDCLKDGSLCEGKADLVSRQSCINEVCNNYGNISQPKSARLNPDGSPANVPGIISGTDFYNKCSIKVKKDSCYTCLKEYFMPAEYCGVIYDFINRSFVKYPAQVYEDLWWGTFNNFADCANSRSSSERIPVGLTCRILPDFVFPDGGTCRSLCDVTDDELKDTADDEPNDSDCGNGATWRSGGYHPGGQYSEYLVRKRIKCCAALIGHLPDLYRLCRGITGDVVEEEETVCHPDETGYALATTNLNMDRGPAMISGILDGGGYPDTVILRADSLNAAAQKVTVYITRPYCDAHRVMDGWHVYWSDTDGDGSFSQKFTDIHETHPNEWLGFCKNADGSDVNPSNILCTFDIDDPTNPQDADGRPYKVCSGLSSYAIQGKTRQDCINAGVPASVCDSGSRYYTGGLYLVAKPDTPTSLGGAAWCVGE